MTMSMIRKARWIAEELGENQDDVYDVLLGNITAPYDFYNSVLSLASDYDNQYEKATNELR